jgi:hypothetical protein
MTTGSYRSPINLQLPRDTPDNFTEADAKELYQIIQQSAQNLIEGLTKYTGLAQQDSALWSALTPAETILSQNHNRLYIQASETIALGAVVNLYNNAGVLNVRNANATNTTKPAYGWCTTAGGITSGDFGEVILKMGCCINISGLTVGTRYWLSTTNGLITATMPAVSGNIQQYIGVALSTTQLFMDIQPDYITVP